MEQEENRRALGPPSGGGARPRAPGEELRDAWADFQKSLTALVHGGCNISRALVNLAADLLKKSGPLNSLHPSGEIAAQCLAGWEDLMRATEIATDTVQQNIGQSIQNYTNCFNNLLAAQEASDCELALKNRRWAEDAICENVLHLVSLQYQFSVACADSFAHLSTCPCCQAPAAQPHDPECLMSTLKQCFSRLYESNAPRSSSGSPHHTTLDQHTVNRHYMGPRMILLPHMPPYQHQIPYQHSAQNYVPTKPAYTYSVPPPPYGSIPVVHGYDNRAFSGSGSSSESQYVPNEAHRPPFMQAEGYRGRSPTARRAEPQGPSPPTSYHEGIWVPKPIDGRRPSYMEMRGPLPPPGLLTATQFKTPLNCQLFPLEGQRRWSEAAAAEMRASHTDDGTMRRWSMPHDARPAAFGPPPGYPVLPHLHRRMRLQPPPSERSGSATPEWQTDMRQNVMLCPPPDGLVDALQLLSHRPSRALLHNPAVTSHNTPSHTIHEGIAEVFPEEESMQLRSSLTYKPWSEQQVIPPPAGYGLPPPGAPSAPSARSAPIGPSGPVQNVESMREFTLFGNNEPFSCLRNITMAKD